MRRKPRGPREKLAGEQERAQRRTLTLNILKALSEGNRIFTHTLMASGSMSTGGMCIGGTPTPQNTLVYLQVKDCEDLHRN